LEGLSHLPHWQSQRSELLCTDRWGEAVLLRHVEQLWQPLGLLLFVPLVLVKHLLHERAWFHIRCSCRAMLGGDSTDAHTLHCGCMGAGAAWQAAGSMQPCSRWDAPSGPQRVLIDDRGCGCLLMPLLLLFVPPV
jgi:hypothetical protein